MIGQSVVPTANDGFGSHRPGSLVRGVKMVKAMPDMLPFFNEKLYMSARKRLEISWDLSEKAVRGWKIVKENDYFVVLKNDTKPG